MRSTATITDVANAAKVARSTVSRVFSQPSRFRPETVTRVQVAAANLGYAPNPLAKALSTGTAAAIGIVVPDIGNPFFPPIIHTAGLCATRFEIAVLIADTEETASREASAMEKLATRTDGIILVSSRQSNAAVLQFASRVPVVLINRDIPGIPRVLISTKVGMTQAVEHLAGLGHTHIAYVAGPRRSWSNQERINAVLEACGRLHLDLTTLKATNPTYEDGMQVAGVLLGSRATAVIAFDDLVAQGIMAGLAAMGTPVPKDMSVIGCDNLVASRTYPPLTSIDSRASEAGTLAVELLLQHADKDTRIVTESDLVVRSTTVKPRRT
ncbi:MAG: LacI family transcriptional regulator [Propionibacteriaceae bacterium]|nr:LacI family transcriptional regulator [Propionibacteriaceae bacterium]